MNQPEYMQDASYQVLGQFYKGKQEVIAPLVLAIIGIILVAAFFAFKDCIIGFAMRKRSLAQACKNPSLFAQWKMRQLINKHTPRWSYADRRRLFEAVWEAGANSRPGEIEAMFYKIQNDRVNHQFIQECLQ